MPVAERQARTAYRRVNSPLIALILAMFPVTYNQRLVRLQFAGSATASDKQASPNQTIPSVSQAFHYVVKRSKRCHYYL